MKHLVALFLACAMLLFLPACGGEQINIRDGDV